MAYGKDPKVEVESLAKRFPKRGIDPTIPEGVRMQLMDMRRQEEQDKGMKAHESRKLAKGGQAKGFDMKKVKRYESGGMTDFDRDLAAIKARATPDPQPIPSGIGAPMTDTPPPTASFTPPPPIQDRPLPPPEARPLPPMSTSTPIPPDEDVEPPRPVDERYWTKKSSQSFVQPPISRRLPMASGPMEMRKGGQAKAYAKGGKVSSASSRGDGCAQRGKTKGTMR